MWEQSLLTSAVQVEALRLLSDWWRDWPRRDRASRGRRQAVGAADGTMADVLVMPPAPRLRIWTSGWPSHDRNR